MPAATTSPESPRRTETSPFSTLMRATARPRSYRAIGLVGILPGILILGKQQHSSEAYRRNRRRCQNALHGGFNLPHPHGIQIANAEAIYFQPHN